MEELLEEDKVLDYLAEYYHYFLNHSSYSIEKKQIELKDIIDSFSVDDKKRLKEELLNIRFDILYDSNLHGKNHSEKVLFWAFVLGKRLNLSKEEERILLDASKYHDIGRKHDQDDDIHGEISANEIEKYLNDNIYDDSENIRVLKAIIELHSLDDKKEMEIQEKYKLENNSKFSLLWKLLKDIDALDRIRYDLGHLDDKSFNPNYLRIECSKEYIKASYELCTYYQKREKEKK